MWEAPASTPAVPAGQSFSPAGSAPHTPVPCGPHPRRTGRHRARRRRPATSGRARTRSPAPPPRRGPSCSRRDARSSRRQVCGKAASCAASSCAAARARPGATTRLTSPICRASAASTERPVRTRSMARLVPISRGSRTVPPSISGTPQRRQYTPKTAVSSATRRSHQSASSRPPATAWPAIAAMTGLRQPHPGRAHRPVAVGLDAVAGGGADRRGGRRRRRTCRPHRAGRRRRRRDRRRRPGRRRPGRPR